MLRGQKCKQDYLAGPGSVRHDKALSRALLSCHSHLGHASAPWTAGFSRGKCLWCDRYLCRLFNISYCKPSNEQHSFNSMSTAFSLSSGMQKGLVAKGVLVSGSWPSSPSQDLKPGPKIFGGTLHLHHHVPCRGFAISRD